MALMALMVSLAHRRYRSASHRHDRQSQVLLMSQRLGIELRRAPLAAVVAHYPSGNPTTGDLALSMLTPLLPDGSYQQVADGRLLYQAHLVYYRESGSQSIRSIRVPLPSPTSQIIAQSVSDIQTAMTLPGAHLWVEGPSEFFLVDSQGATTQQIGDPLRVTSTLLGVPGPGKLPFTLVADFPG